MERKLLNETLSGGYIEQYQLDVAANRLSLSVDVLENGTLSRHRVLFEKVSRFVFETESRSDAGDRLELTELWIDTTPESSATEEWELTISIFDLTHLRIRCSSISVDGDMLL